MGEKSSAPARTPAKTPVTAKKTTNASSTSSTGKQQSILGFFSKSATPSSTAASTPAPSKSVKLSPSSTLKESKTKFNSAIPAKRPTTLTPVPSSDAVEPLSSQENKDAMQIDTKLSSDSLPSPGSSAGDNKDVLDVKPPAHSSPSRKVRESSPDFHKPHTFVPQADIPNPARPGRPSATSTHPTTRMKT